MIFVTWATATSAASPAVDDDLREALARRQPTGRLGAPADVARLVAFLLSDDGAWTTGQVIRTDGGLSSQVISPELEGGDPEDPWQRHIKAVPLDRARRLSERG